MLEDVTDIIFNIKGLVVSLDSDEPKVMRLAATGPGEVTADLIEADTAVTIHNPDHVVATLTDEVDFECEMTVAKGRGYEPASEQYAARDEQVIGDIPIDALYSPVQRVRYRVEDTRIGQKTNYDKLILDVWTDGTTSPELIVVEAAKLLIRKLNMRLTDLDMSVRASNCLESAEIRSVAELVQKEEPELLNVRSFGKTSLREVKRRLRELGLSLGMQLPEGYQPESNNPGP